MVASSSRDLTMTVEGNIMRRTRSSPVSAIHNHIHVPIAIVPIIVIIYSESVLLCSGSVEIEGVRFALRQFPQDGLHHLGPGLRRPQLQPSMFTITITIAGHGDVQPLESRGSTATATPSRDGHKSYTAHHGEHGQPKLIRLKWSRKAINACWMRPGSATLSTATTTILGCWQDGN